MFKKFFKKKSNTEINADSILVAALLVHAAKIDENYTDVERKMIKKAIITLNKISENEAQEILDKAEKKEQESDLQISFSSFYLEVPDTTQEEVSGRKVVQSQSFQLIAYQTDRWEGILIIKARKNPKLK